jgi:hypothetical protein
MLIMQATCCDSFSINCDTHHNVSILLYSLFNLELFFVILIAIALAVGISTRSSSYLLHCDAFRGYTAVSENGQADMDL